VRSRVGKGKDLEAREANNMFHKLTAG